MYEMTDKKVSGLKFEELSLEQMESIQGSGDMQAETTPVAWFTIGLGSGTVLSILKC